MGDGSKALERSDSGSWPLLSEGPEVHMFESGYANPVERSFVELTRPSTARAVWKEMNQGRGRQDPYDEPDSSGHHRMLRRSQWVAEESDFARRCDR